MMGGSAHYLIPRRGVISCVVPEMTGAVPWYYPVVAWGGVILLVALFYFAPPSRYSR
jgi:hypothetical protein